MAKVPPIYAMEAYENISDGKTFNNKHLVGAILIAEYHIEMGSIMVTLTCVLIVSSLLSYLMSHRVVSASPQLIAMIAGVVLTLVVSLMTNDGTQATTYLARFFNPTKLMALYYPCLLLKCVYSIDIYVFMKSLSQILIISVFGWCTFVLCFGFTLTIFASELSTLSALNIILPGVILAPTEIPPELFNVDQIKTIEVILTAECVFSNVLSLTIFPLLLGEMQNIFKFWYQRVLVLFRFLSLGFIIGIIFGSIAGKVFVKTCSNAIHMMLALTSTVFLLYEMCASFIYCSAGLCVFLFLFFISRRRLDIPIQIDAVVNQLIDTLFCCLSTIASFLAVIQTLPYFFKQYSVVGAAISVAIYILANVLRFLFFIIISPILSRLGYGFNFKTLVTMVWCLRKGPLNFIMLMMAVMDGSDKRVTRYQLHLGLNFLLLMNLLNQFFSWTILTKLGITGSEYLGKRPNIRAALKQLRQGRNSLLAVMHMNRFYSDANWTTVHKVTKIHPNLSDTLFKTDEFETKTPYCPSCKREVPYEATQKETQENMNDVKLRILHANRVSFVRQYENGLIDSKVLSVLIHAFDAASESKGSLLNIDNLVKRLQKRFRHKTFEKMRHFMFSNTKKRADNYIPHYPICYIVSRHWGFLLTFDMIAVAQIIYSVWTTASERTDYGLMDIMSLLVYVLFVLEFIIMLLGSMEHNIKDAFRRYLKSFWNKIDFIVISLGIFDTVFTMVLNYSEITFGNSQNVMTWMMYTLRIMRILRFTRMFRVFRLIANVQRAIMYYYDKHIDAKLAVNYAMAWAIVVCYQEVSDTLNNITNDQKVITTIRKQMINDKNLLAKEIGNIDKDRPWLNVNIQTRQATMCTLKNMSDAVNRLKNSGSIDYYEFKKVSRILADRWKEIQNNHNNTNQPRTILYELPWIAEEDAVFEYIYDNVSLRVWDSGDTIFSQGDIVEGVIIIIKGMFKVTYVPDPDIIDVLNTQGLLPIRDMVRHTRFDEEEVDYIFKGNSIGELAVMTGRPCCCEVVAETPSQAFVIPCNVINEAVKISKDPVNGLYSRIWYHISANLVRRLLLQTSLYSKMSHNQLNDVISRSIMPRLEAYQTLMINETIEDVVLVEGTVIDHVTKEVYVAPCVIPRGTAKLVLATTTDVGILSNSSAKLWLIPLKDTDPYDVMVYTEIISDLNTQAASSCYLSKNMAYKKYQKNTGRTKRMLPSMHRALNAAINLTAMETRSTLVRSTLLRSTPDGFFDHAEGETPLSDDETEELSINISIDYDSPDSDSKITDGTDNYYIEQIYAPASQDYTKFLEQMRTKKALEKTKEAPF